VILPLGADTPEEPERIGGKACGLVRLLRCGLDVPEAWCMPVDLLQGEEPSRALVAELHAFWDRLAASSADLRLAVRSSASAEDLASASFAGIHETRLGVGSAGELVAAVRHCRRAASSARARHYRDSRGAVEGAGLALVLQRMVAAGTSGVLLTANPARAFAREIVVEAAWGLGEAVASGLTEPDHIVLDRDTGAILRESVGDKASEIVLVPGRGTVRREVEGERRARRCLTDGELAGLFELARQVERRIGRRQDCEWAFEDGSLRVLQQRPITGLPPEEPTDVWTRGFGDEYLADCTTPLSADLLTPWIVDEFLRHMARACGNHAAARMEPLHRHHGYVYLSGAFTAAMLRALPRRFRGAASMGWFTPLWAVRIEAEPWRPRLALGLLRARRRDPRSSLAENPRALERHCRRIEQVVVPRLGQDCTALSEAEWRRQLDEADELGREHFRIIRWGVGLHAPALHAVLERSLRSLACDHDGELYRTIIAGLVGIRTSETDRDIWRLAAAARRDPELAALLVGGTTHDGARRALPAALFWTRFDELLGRHGHRAPGRDLALPRWRESPDAVLGLLRPHLVGEPAADPALAVAEAVRRREEAETTALRRAARGPLGRLRRAWLAGLVRRTVLYTGYRENQRYYLDFLLAHMRALVVEMGRRLTSAGVLDDPQDVFLLEAAELWQVVERPVPRPDLRTLVDERRRAQRVWGERLPASFLFDGVETEGEIAEGDLGTPAVRGREGAITGRGASRGRARGRARVIREPAGLGEVQPGEILVTGTTDPGWSSLFPLLGGLVTETGGLLSHGALLAREYGLPAVTGVRDATRRLESGELLEIDGAEGWVRPLERRGTSPAGPRPGAAGTH
jgi:pyruvate,water dikinase